ncbi:rod shape-determining protein MreC [Jiulongibacter sediminis]|uniref:Cell shape-determining protein MreC n=1 Tax=Jiulongibacter sediminis TaxID=1605367 RepID=A0A0P7BUM7_9BACT|nr:rod shape-determining protein MreC [Jiulongibacter sediminis]KPM48511.1 rod shape-determining protein MreC [Jiulongibacter sediminis]TBX25049.1 rod shape-determining protein MreC [Jiulongibacter sediminis]
MSQLLGLLNRAKYFLLFLFLELVSFYLIKKNNVQWDVTLFNSSNAVASRTMELSYGAKEYLHLKDENQSLAAENAVLREMMTAYQQSSETRPSYFYEADSLYADRFEFKIAKVVNSTTARTKNYVTIDKGTLDGIEPGMGVIGPKGVIGQVKSCSDHFSVVYSILHSDFRVSSEVVNKKLVENNETALGLCVWPGESRSLVEMNTVDKFKPVAVGDSVVTSSQNLIFPPNILVGNVSEVITPTNGAFHEISVKLATDFGGLTYVYVVQNRLSSEQQSLEEEALENE